MSRTLAKANIQVKINPQDQLEQGRVASLVVLGLILLHVYCKCVPKSIKDSDSLFDVKV